MYVVWEGEGEGTAGDGRREVQADKGVVVVTLGHGERRARIDQSSVWAFRKSPAATAIITYHHATADTRKRRQSI
jgi:hypothetical protein